MTDVTQWLINQWLLPGSETRHGRVLLPGAAGAQQLQHLPLAQEPQLVRGPEENRPAQVRFQNRTGPESHPVPPHVSRVLILTHPTPAQHTAFFKGSCNIAHNAL